METKKIAKNNMCPIYGKTTDKHLTNSNLEIQLILNLKCTIQHAIKLFIRKCVHCLNREYPEAVTHWVSTRASPREQ